MVRKFIMLLSLIIVVTSCSSDNEISEELMKLSEAKSIWRSSQPKNYSMNERISCFCGGLLEWEVYVKEGVKDKVEYDESQAFGQTYDDIFNNAKTIEDTFDFIESLLNQDIASLVIEYDDEYGFPSLISIDYVENIADDEIDYSYTEFEVTD